MIVVNWWVLKNSEFCKITKVEIKGHANFSVLGKDIVCAAVSGIVNGTINFLKKEYKDFGFIFYSKKKIEIVPNKWNYDYQFILIFMIFQLKNISFFYFNFLKIFLYFD